MRSPRKLRFSFIFIKEPPKLNLKVGIIWSIFCLNFHGASTNLARRYFFDFLVSSCIASFIKTDTPGIINILGTNFYGENGPMGYIPLGAWLAQILLQGSL